MSNLTVYDIEKECGLEEQLLSQASVAFVVAPADKIDFKEPSSLEEVVKAGLEDPDVHKVLSILVSTVWNRNGDVFDKSEVWAARQTPRFKPTNLDHDEKQMVGGIINSWPVDSEFRLIADSTTVEDLPDTYHILVSSVIYKQWRDPELKARAENLIKEIEAGTKYVSMECLFTGFDYAVISPEGENHIVARSEQTAFLTQHLRAYGGSGEFQGHKVGRLLRNITFSGKGFTDRPANPDSVIFDTDHIFSFTDANTDKSLFLDHNGVSSSEEKQLYSKVSMKGKSIMSNEILNDQLKELKEALAAVQAENKELTEQLSEANVSGFEVKIEKLEAAVAESAEKIIALEKTLAEAEVKAETLEQDLATKSESLEATQAELTQIKEDEKTKSRKSQMSEAGLSDEEIEAKFDSFASMSDEQFDTVIETLASLKPAVEETVTEEVEEEAVAEEVEAEVAEEEVVEASEVAEEETEEGELAISSEEEVSEISVARAGLNAWAEQLVSK